MILSGHQVMPGSIRYMEPNPYAPVQVMHVAIEFCRAARLISFDRLPKEDLIYLSEVLACGLADYAVANQEKYGQRDHQRGNRPYGDFE
jgi:hypothetical protein